MTVDEAIDWLCATQQELQYLNAAAQDIPGWIADELKRQRDENVLLTEVLNRARFTLLASIKGTPEQLGDAFGALSLACKAHWDWQTERISAQSEGVSKP